MHRKKQGAGIFLLPCYCHSGADLPVAQATSLAGLNFMALPPFQYLVISTYTLTILVIIGNQGLCSGTNALTSGNSGVSGYILALGILCELSILGVSSSLDLPEGSPGSSGSPVFLPPQLLHLTR